MSRNELLFEVLGGDLIEGAGSDARAGNAQFLGFGKNFFVFQSKFL